MALTGSVFTLVPRRRLVGLSFGGMHSARRGTGTDVAGSRPDVPGDDVDAIDWAASAKLSSARGTDEFVFSDFLDTVSDSAWLAALEHRWDVVPVVIQDPVWEQSFPDVAGVVVPLADPATGRVSLVRLSRREVEERRHANETRRAALLG